MALPSSAQPQKIFHFGNCELDLAAGELRRNGGRLRLQEQPFQVLACLVERRGALVTREELRERMWPADTFVDFDHGLNTAINKLRETLGDSANHPKFIETVPRKGYRFIYPIHDEDTAGVSAMSPAGIEVESLPQASSALVRTLFLLLQFLYLAFYVSALANLHEIPEVVDSLRGAGPAITELLIATAAIGIAVRLYIISATSFAVKQFPTQFRRIFPALFALDELWALSPLLLWQHLGYGLSLACVATLVWLPFAQRTLVRMQARAR